MTTDDIKERLKELRDSCIDNPDKYFNEEILIDYNHALQYDPLDIDYLLGKNEWYLYWYIRAKEILGLQESIAELGKKKTRDSLFLELIAIKKVIDTKLLEIKDEKIICQDLGITPIDQHIIDLNFTDNVLPTVIDKFHSLLTTEGLISCKLPAFREHF